MLAEAESSDAPRLVLLGFQRVGSALLADLERLHPALVPHTLLDINTEVALGVLSAVYAALNASLPSYLEALEEEHGPLERRSEVVDRGARRTSGACRS